MDADGLTFACATQAERRVARRAGAATALVGLGAANGVPDGPLVSFGLAGALRGGLAPGTVVDATRIVDVEGRVLWEGGPLGVDGAETVTTRPSDCACTSARAPMSPTSRAVRSRRRVACAAPCAP
jgi:hypothetical protein